MQWFIRQFVRSNITITRRLRPTRLVFPLIAVLLTAPAAFAARPVSILAAENFYGDVAQQIGGDNVKVVSVLSNPDQDPHLFEVSPSEARNVSNAKIVIYNGIGYDPWIEKLLAAARNPDRTVIDVAEITGRKSGDNPHIWYDPATVLALAKTLTTDLCRDDPVHAPGYQRRMEQFRQSLEPIRTKIAALRQRFVNTPMTATEPVFDYMLKALGMQVRNRGFQLAVMNNTEPGASTIAALEDDLRQHRVRLLVYNRQTSTPMTERILAIARSSHIPVVAVTETEPPGINYQTWVLNELDAVEQALSKPAP